MSKLFYKQSAKEDWNKALPIGNGRLGAMIFAGESMEHYQLNEDSLWFGGAKNRNNPDAFSHLEEVRTLILNGKIEEAQRLLTYAFSGVPQSQSSYQTLGDLYLDFCGCLENPMDYYRELDLTTAIHTVKTTEQSTGITYERECFASFSKQCIVTRIKANKKGCLSIAASLQRASFYEGSRHTEDTLLMSGSAGGGGVDFCAGIKLIPVQGTVRAMGEHVIVNDCDEVVVLLTAATSFRYKHPESQVEKILAEAAEVAYEELRKEHIEEYSSYFSRLSFSLITSDDLNEIPTDKRMERLKEGESDDGLAIIYFDYGRYLLISSSRGDCLPANLQGIWNGQLDPPWGSKFTININTEMNYWPACSSRLTECELPLFSLLKRMKAQGEITAKEMYGCRGFVAHHNTDLWANTAPQDIYIPASYWVMGGAWHCTHVWDYYDYTRDKRFLKLMYPVVKSSVQFFMDYLIEVDGYLVTCPSVSPENTYIQENGEKGCVCAGAVMDIEILTDLFNQCIKEAEIVKDNDFIQEIEQVQAKLPPLKIGKYGQLMEWQKDYEEAEPGHRHISHLWALHPSWQITPDQKPDLCEAAKVTLSRRLSNGGGHTGWSRAWIINLYARLWEGEQAYNNLMELLRKSTLDNLLDNHPPFQIDGNFGATAAITEMILQSGAGRIVILPALPKQWTKGSMCGIGARGRLTVDIHWDYGQLLSAIFYADGDISVPLIYQGRQTELNMHRGETKRIYMGDFS